MVKNNNRDYSFLFEDFVSMVDKLHYVEVPKDYIKLDRIYAPKYTKENAENKNPK